MEFNSSEPFLLKRKNVYMCTSSKYVVYNFQWTIENFSFYECLKDEYKAIRSPSFGTEDRCNSWRLELYYNGQNGQKRGSEGYLSLFLINENMKSRFNIKSLLSLVPNMGLKKWEITMSRSEKIRGISKFLSREALFKDPAFLSTDSLTVLCEIRVLENSGEQSFEGLTKKKTATLSEDMLSSLVNDKFCDVILSVGDRELKAHKFILAARSSVFSAMFTDNFKETKTNVVSISDTPPNIMEEVIHYLYTDKLPKLKELVEDVLPVADKYALHGLKDMCAEELYSQLKIDNAIHTLLLADLYNVHNLKESVVSFISMNYRAVVATPSWIELETNKHPLAAEVALAILSKLHLTERRTN